ncbi:hypothetical protein UPYG_G00238670 [Umbra pygmaea]|uniref:USP domain-containing protein n=1 Tax=Umbra pygmaea TaxID=75934 RepID=A0ABD0WEZ3_UMBPY
MKIEQNNPKDNRPKKKGCDEAIVRRFKMRLDLIFAYNGLGNQGSTCYLNSVLQVFFMTKDFRGAVESHVSQDQKNIDFQLKSLFKTLKTSEAHPKDILTILNISNVYKQRDAAEYFEMILNKVHPDLSQIFKGHLRHTTRCSKRHVTGVETGPFWTLPLSLKALSESNKSCSVRKCFEEFFQPLTVCGIYCDQCEGKTDATIACELIQSPEILTLLLKRFEFDNHSMSYVKIESQVDVPHIYHAKDCTYELYAVVDHVGSLRGGHYTATIKSYEDHNWYRFDDTYVRPDTSQVSQQGESFSSEKAYLLMYRKELYL